MNMKKLFKILRNLNGQMISSSNTVIFIPLKKESTSDNMILLETSRDLCSSSGAAMKGVVLREVGGEIVPKLAYISDRAMMHEFDIVDLMVSLGRSISSKEKEIINEYKFNFVAKDQILFELHNEIW